MLYKKSSATSDREKKNDYALQGLNRNLEILASEIFVRRNQIQYAVITELDLK